MKTVLAFVAGAALAGGLVFLALRPNQSSEQTVQSRQPPVLDLGEPALPAPAPEPLEAAPPASARPAPKPRPFRLHTVSAAAPEPRMIPPPPEVEQEPTNELPVIPVALASAPEVGPAPEPNRVTLAAGTLVTVRLAEDLSSEKNVSGDLFSATLDQPLVIDGLVIAERGSRAEGRVAEAERAGKVKGVAVLALQLTRFNTSDGQKIAITTDTFTKHASSEKMKDAAKVGAAASIGAAIGAIAGGGKGAAIGGAIGGAAGAGGVMATRGVPAELPAETRISFRINTPVTITERLP